MAVIVALAALVACGGVSSGRRIAEEIRPSEASANVQLLEPDVALYAAPLVLVGEVIGVEGPFWNQDNGQKWEADDGGKPTDLLSDYTIPILYREISIEVSEVLRDDIKLTPYEGDYLQTISESPVQAVKSASNEDPMPGDTFTFVTSSGDEVGPLFSVGKRVAVLLQLTVLPLREKPVIVYWTFQGPNGTYRLVENEGAEVAVLDAEYWTSGTDPSSGEVIVVTTLPRSEALESAADLDDFARQVTEIREIQNPDWELERLEPGWAEFHLVSALRSVEENKTKSES